MTSSESAKDLFKSPTFKQPKSVQLDSVLCKWFTAMPSKGKPSGPMITEKIQSFYVEIKINDKCIFP